MPERTLHEECGVFGAIGVDNAYDVVMTGLAALQHRGQEGCGIAYADAQGSSAWTKDRDWCSGSLPR